MVNIEDFERSDTEIQTYESIEDLKFPQEYENNSIFILDDLNQKKIDDPRVQAMFKRSRHNNLSIFLISEYYYELSKKQYVVLVISITYSHLTISEMFKISIKTKHPWIWLSMNSNT